MRQRERLSQMAHHDKEKETMLLEVERINKVEQVKRDNELRRQKEHAAFLQAQATSKILERHANEKAERERIEREMSQKRRCHTLLG
jgi:hypothetical protein